MNLNGKVQGQVDAETAIAGPASSTAKTASDGQDVEIHSFKDSRA